MRSDNIYEASSVVKDVTDIIKDGLNKADSVVGSTSISRASSLSKATSGLNIIFPCLVSNTINPETAMMVSRAVERKAVSLLQIAFSAFDITNSKDPVEYLRNFHTNLKGKISLDDFIDAIDTYATENNFIPKENLNMYKAVLEDLRSISVYYPDDVSESSLMKYKITEGVYGRRIFIEERSQESRDKEENDYRFQYQKRRDYVKDYTKLLDDRDKKKQDDEDRKYQRRRDEEYDRRQKERDEREDKRDAAKAARDNVQNQKDIQQMFTSQIFSSDVKKANEMVPTMMVINFVVLDGEHQIHKEMVIGVKAKLFPVESQDVINKIVVKNADKNILLKFIKASTKEISFLKDFLFAIDNAKLSAIGNSKRGSSTNKLLKVLERRALNGKIRKAFKLNNAYKAIATLVVSKEEVDYIQKYNNIDIMDPKVIRPIMENLSLMMFIVTDDSNETASILMDSGDDLFETISYTHLEREASDNSSKKIINLMTRMAR